MVKKLNVEKLFKGRSHRFGEKASDPRESGAARKAHRTIREHRDDCAQRADSRPR